VCGIDDAFGASLTPVLDTFPSSKNFAAHVTSSIAAGGATDLLVLDPGDDSARSGAFYNAAPLGYPPRWDGTDVWSVDVASLDDQGNPMLAFPAGYTNGQTWVGAPASGDGMFTMGPTADSTPFHVPVTHVRISVSLNADGSVNGVFSGILPAVSLATAIERYADEVSPSLCTADYFPAVSTQVFQAADILVDGTQSTGMACDAVSIGFAFTASQVVLGPAVSVPEMGDPCAGDAGVGD
jgi:hypothetical protein